MLEEIKKLKSIADVGLLYCTNEYDRERYSEIQQISFSLLKEISNKTIDELKEVFPVVKEYPTAKTDVRGMVLSEEGKILLVQESADGKWSLPGGWADVGYSPAEVIVKEFKEETGLDIVPQQLVAVFDKRKHLHPPQPFYIYKLVFYCKALSANLVKGFDVLDVRYFDINHLPELSEDRILKSQLHLLYKKITASDWETYFD